MVVFSGSNTSNSFYTGALNDDPVDPQFTLSHMTGQDVVTSSSGYIQTSGLCSYGNVSALGVQTVYHSDTSPPSESPVWACATVSLLYRCSQFITLSATTQSRSRALLDGICADVSTSSSSFSVTDSLYFVYNLLYSHSSPNTLLPKYTANITPTFSSYKHNTQSSTLQSTS